VNAAILARARARSTFEQDSVGCRPKLMREYEKGGTAASIKAAMYRAIDQLHR